jgi:hypothetical protein
VSGPSANVQYKFLSAFSLYLSSMVQPSRALMPTLLAKYNISFYDAIGRPPRILDYDCFVSYKVWSLQPTLVLIHFTCVFDNMSRYFKLSLRTHFLAGQAQRGLNEDYTDFPMLGTDYP